MATWQCVKQCGACCNLEPDDRPDLDHYLTEAELAQYLSMVGEGGWCIHFDHELRLCTIYDERPRFCRVKPDIFQEMYDVAPEDFNEFAIACCEEQIEGVYGDGSPEQERYQQIVVGLDDLI